MHRLRLLACTGALLAAAGSGNAQDAETPAPRLRRPVALAFAAEGKLLLAANERSGSISIVDLEQGKCVRGVQIGRSLSDLVAVPGRDGRFLATDRGAHRVYLLEMSGTRLSVVDSLPVAAHPLTVRVDKEGKRAYVTSLWPGHITVIDLGLDANGAIGLSRAAEIPYYTPRLQIPTPDGKHLVIADAFDGGLNVMDVSTHEIVKSNRVPGQNIRGLAWSNDGRRLYIAQQILSPNAETTAADIHWGSLISNVIRTIEIDSLVDPQQVAIEGSRVTLLGDIGNGGGDPAAIAVKPDGSLIVALAGTGEVALGKPDGSPFAKIPSGIRPTAVLPSADFQTIYVADTFGDAIIVLKEGATTTISLGPQPELTAADRGELVYHDARISHDRWMSCQSCHPDGHSTGFVADTLGDGSYGAPKRIPSLGGVVETGPWGWNGIIEELTAQVRKSVETTMRGKPLSDGQVADLTEYVSTFAPAPPFYVSPSESEWAAIERGRAIFNGQKCNRCHVPPTYTSPEAYDVGLTDEVGNTRFNPPSLRGVFHRPLHFHDATGMSLQQVFTEQKHQLTADLSAPQLADLVMFLESL